MKKYFSIFLSIILITSLLIACGNTEADGESQAEGESVDKGEEIIIGAKFFTEQFLLSKITTLYLKNKGINIKEIENLGSTAVREALVNKQIDLYWEYTGTALLTYLGEDAISDGEESYNKVKELDQKNGIIWENRTDINNTFALVMKREDAEELGIKTISDLAQYVNDNPGELSIAVDSEFGNRADGIKGVQETYGFDFGTKNIKTMEQGLQYNALKNGDVDVTFGYATDAQIKEFDFVILEDDKTFFPAYYAAITIREDVAEKHPELIELTADIANKLDSETMMMLNYRVDIEGEHVDDVAKSWLEENGMLD